MCDERGDKSPPSLLRPSDKIIVPARLPSLVLVSFVFHLVAPALVYGDYSSSERYLEPFGVFRPIGSRFVLHGY